ncbi:MFS transporter [Rhodococcus erythropolis]|uniref:MFS transporter n=1 Tax=Rhodococcus erythropolis TaxID=1833 RepID=UPI000690B0B2|nr:MFS transporter [Rhodococcus erythropolis]
MEKTKLPYRTVSNRLKWSRLATFFGFFQLGAVIVMWSTSTTSLRFSLGWEGDDGDASFGSLAFALGLGFAIGCAVSGPLIDKWGCRNIAIPSLTVYPLMYIPLAFLDGMIGLLAFGLLAGTLRGFVDIVINVNGVQLERHYGRPIISSFHAAYPAGGFLFGLVGSAFARSFTESAVVPFLAMGLTMSALGYVFGRMYLRRDEEIVPAAHPVPAGVRKSEEHSKSNDAKYAGLAVMVGFGLLAFVSYLAENATYDWGQEFVRRTLDTTAGTAALAVTVFSGSQFVGRMLGDKLTERFGQKAVICGSGVIGALGAACMMTAVSPVQALLGFGLVGLGVSCIVPIMLSAAGRMDPQNSGRNIGLVNAVGVTGMFLGPAAITTVVDRMGIEWMPLLPLVLLALIAIAGPILVRKAPRFTATVQSESAVESIRS